MSTNYVIELRKGHIYFHAMYFDHDLTVPSIDTVVYEGRDDDGIHLFRDAESYVALQNGESVSETCIMGIADKDLDGILDKGHLIDWLSDEHSPRTVGPSYDYRVPE